MAIQHHPEHTPLQTTSFWVRFTRGSAGIHIKDAELGARIQAAQTARDPANVRQWEFRKEDGEWASYPVEDNRRLVAHKAANINCSLGPTISEPTRQSVVHFHQKFEYNQVTHTQRAVRCQITVVKHTAAASPVGNIAVNPNPLEVLWEDIAPVDSSAKFVAPGTKVIPVARSSQSIPSIFAKSQASKSAIKPTASQRPAASIGGRASRASQRSSKRPAKMYLSSDDDSDDDAGAKAPARTPTPNSSASRHQAKSRRRSSVDAAGGGEAAQDSPEPQERNLAGDADVGLGPPRSQGPSMCISQAPPVPKGPAPSAGKMAVGADTAPIMPRKLKLVQTNGLYATIRGSKPIEYVISKKTIIGRENMYHKLEVLHKHPACKLEAEDFNLTSRHNGKQVIIGRRNVKEALTGGVPKFCVDDLQISRKHAMIQYGMLAGQSTITSYSSNGTYINLVRIEQNTPTPLPDGCAISFGGLSSHEPGFLLNSIKDARCSVRFNVVKTARKKVNFDEQELLVRDARAEVSRKHAYITPNPDGTLSVRDLGSVNGVWLNRTKIAPKTAVLVAVGDEILLGGADQNQKIGSKITTLDPRIYAFEVCEAGPTAAQLID